MLKEGVKASDIEVATFERNTTEQLKDSLNAWLSANNHNTIYDVMFQQSNTFSALIVYKQGREPSPDTEATVRKW